MQSRRPAQSPSGYPKLLGLLLIASLLLRVVLIVRGGTGYWPDEHRFGQSVLAVRHAFAGDLVEAFAAIDSADHILFKLIGIIPAALARTLPAHLNVPTLFFGLFSVLNIWILWRLARRLGAREREAFLAAFLLALSSTFFYYSRHLVPYDLALTFALLALHVAVRQPALRTDSCWCGFLSALCFLTYNGYWTAAAFVPLLHLGWGRPGLSAVVSRGAWAGLGFLTPVFVVGGASELLGGNYITGARAMSQSITVGEFSEGGTFPFEFLWHAEHLLLLAWLLAFGWSVWELSRGRATERSKVGIAGAVFVYAALFASSVVFEKFVLYGRLVRPLVPFLCLLLAGQLDGLRSSRRPLARWAYPALLGTLVMQAALNFHGPLTLSFPADFVARAQEIASGRRDLHTRILYGHFIFPEPYSIVLPPHEILLQEPHPAQFLPYQYEGYDPRQRSLLRSADVSMRLIASDEELPIVP
jgi:hypothetical protein